MLEYFLLQFITICFEKEYKTVDFISIDKEDFNNYKGINLNAKFFFVGSQSLRKIFEKNLTLGKILIPFSSFFLYILITICFARKKSSDYDDIIFFKGIHGILFINSIISFIFSFLCLFQYKSKIIIYSLIPILLSKFYFFTFNFYCVSISNEQKGYELFMSGSTLISLYLIIWNLILKYSILNTIKNDRILYIIQILLSFIIVLYFVIFKFCGIKFKICSDEPCRYFDSCNFCDNCCLNEDFDENEGSLQSVDKNYSNI